jgi:hypothetical protein
MPRYLSLVLAGALITLAVACGGPIKKSVDATQPAAATIAASSPTAAPTAVSSPTAALTVAPTATAATTAATTAASAGPTRAAATVRATSAGSAAPSATGAARATTTATAGTRGAASATSAATTSSGSDASGSVPLDPTLAPALLTLSDLPHGWSNSDDSSSSDSSSTSLFDSSGSSSTDLCGNDQLSDGAIAQNSTGFTPADFSQGLRFVIDGVARYAPGKARTAMDNFQKALKACGGTTSQIDNNGQTAKLTVTPLQLPSLGDQAVGYRIYAESDGFNIGLAIVAIRKGDLLAVLADANLGADTPSDGLLQSLAGKAATKLNAVK